MRALAALAASLTALLAASLATAGGPRDEKVELRAADVALAQRVALRPSDLRGSWRRISVPEAQEGERLTCPGFDPDLSRFTITGKATSGFVQSAGASALSVVEVYRSRADAAGDFAAAAKPIVATCLKAQLERELGAIGATVPVARVVAAPRVGERRTAYRVVARVRTVSLYLDVVVFQKGRSIAALFFTGATKPVAGQARAAAAVAGRMR